MKEKLVNMFPITQMSFLRVADTYLEYARPKHIDDLSPRIWFRKIRSVTIRAMPTEVSFGVNDKDDNIEDQGFHLGLNEDLDNEKKAFFFARLIAQTFAYDLNVNPPKYELSSNIRGRAEDFYDAFATRFVEEVGTNMISAWLQKYAKIFPRTPKSEMSLVP